MLKEDSFIIVTSGTTGQHSTAWSLPAPPVYTALHGELTESHLAFRHHRSTQCCMEPSGTTGQHSTAWWADGKPSCLPAPQVNTALHGELRESHLAFRHHRSTQHCMVSWRKAIVPSGTTGQHSTAWWAERKPSCLPAPPVNTSWSLPAPQVNTALLRAFRHHRSTQHYVVSWRKAILPSGTPDQHNTWWSLPAPQVNTALLRAFRHHRSTPHYAVSWRKACGNVAVRQGSKLSTEPSLPLDGDHHEALNKYNQFFKKKIKKLYHGYLVMTEVTEGKKTAWLYQAQFRADAVVDFVLFCCCF